jgi:hypothetical protein
LYYQVEVGNTERICIMQEIETARLVRDYIYVDYPRVRSHLSQLAGGVPNEEQGKKSKAWQAGFRQIAMATRTDTEEVTETRSLANLHAAMLEDEAAAAGMLPDLSDLASKESVWNKGKFRRLLQPGGLIKVHAPTRIVAAAEITELITKFDAFSTANPIAEQVQMLLGSLYGKQLGIRVFPCGPGIPEKVFAGLFTDVDNYIGDERPLLIPRFGSDAQELTSILQITRLPSRTGDAQVVTRSSMEDIVRSFQTSPDRVNGNILESMIQQMLKMLESAGMLEAPQFPAVGVLPLAIYRNVAPVDEFADTEAQLLAEEEAS